MEDKILCDWCKRYRGKYTNANGKPICGQCILRNKALKERARKKSEKAKAFAAAWDRYPHYMPKGCKN
jgi:galactose-1-phosphate uridylyltransferase